jgi:hypothetical protein
MMPLAVVVVVVVVATTPPLEMKPGQPVEGREESEDALNPSAGRLIAPSGAYSLIIERPESF